MDVRREVAAWLAFVCEAFHSYVYGTKNMQVFQAIAPQVVREILVQLRTWHFMG